MTEKYIFRQATAAEIPAVFDLIMGRVAWMDQVGIRQWNTTKYDQRYPLSYYEQRRQMEELFVLADVETEEILAVGALFHEDERWPEPESAFYLHHLASRVDAKGAGSVFLQMAEDYTARMGKRYMRLDSAVGNRTLEAYYTSRGYVEAGCCKDGLYEGILRQKQLGEVR
jgi:hypothetical protein